MKRTLVFASLILISAGAHAAETLSADAVKKLLTGKTADALGAVSGGTPKTYFAPDGKLYRAINNKRLEGTWYVEADGTHCIQGMPGGCAKIVRNEDGTYDRIKENGEIYSKYLEIVDGKDF